jgi:hypothetical protein
MRQLVFVVAILFSSVVAADDRSETIKQLMEAQGLIQTFEQQLELGRKQNNEQGRAMLDQLMASLSPTPEVTERFEQAFQSFMAEVQTPWGAEEIVAVWGEHYGKHFSDEELDQLLIHYRSPLAQKEVVASRQALTGFSKHFAEAGKPIGERAVAKFIANLRLIAEECNCRR